MKEDGSCRNEVLRTVAEVIMLQQLNDIYKIYYI